MKTILQILALYLLCLTAFGEVVDRTCSPNGGIEFVEFGQLQFRFALRDGRCSISLQRPDQITSGHDTSRNFTINGDGVFAAFSSFYNPAGTTNSLTTGMKSFVLLPAITTPRVYANSETNEIYFQLASGEKVYFTPSGVIDSEKTTDLRISETPEILYNNQGGITLLRNNGPQIDIGFRMGNDPQAQRSRTITIRDTNGRSCTTTNGAIFNTLRRNENGIYIIDNACRESQIDIVRPKATGAELFRLIRSVAPACRNVDLSALENPEILIPTLDKSLEPQAPVGDLPPTTVNDSSRDSEPQAAKESVTIRIEAVRTLEQ